MINDNLVHQKEGCENTESFLQENINDYESNCVFLLKEMRHGKRLTAKMVVQHYGMNDRRLRDLEIAGKCQKEWKLTDEGKRMYVEYFIKPAQPPTKAKVIQFWTNEILHQQNLFP